MFACQPDRRRLIAVPMVLMAPAVALRLLGMKDDMRRYRPVVVMFFHWDGWSHNTAAQKGDPKQGN